MTPEQQAQINASIAKINEGSSALGKERGVNLQTLSPLTNPTSPTTPSETHPPVNTFTGITPTDSEANQLQQNLYNQSQNVVTDQGQIRQDYINMFQDRINALNQVYDQQLSKAKQEGVGRVGQGTAILARRGLAGSPRGTAIQEGVLSQNRGIESAIDAQRNVDIQAIYGKATEMAAEEARARTLAKQEGAKSYIAFLGGQDARKQSYIDQNIQALIAGGYDINEIDVESLAKQLGVNPQSILSAYQMKKQEAEAANAKLSLETRKTEAEIGKYTTDAEMANKKFEEDKRQFGMEYALRARAQSLNETKEAREGKSSSNSQYRVNSMLKVNEFIDEAMGRVNGQTAGFVGNLGAKIEGTPAYDLAANLTTIKANIGFEALQAMREASKTGGALGQVAVQELTALQSVLGSLDQGQSPATLIANLNKIKSHYSKAINAIEGGSTQANNIITAPDGQQVEIID